MNTPPPPTNEEPEPGLDVGSGLAERALRMTFSHDPYLAGYQAGMLEAARMVWHAFGATAAGGYLDDEICLVRAAIDGRLPSYIKTEVA
jgi:hypothetical protein